MLEMLAPNFLYNAAKDLIKFGLGFRKRQFTPEEKLSLRDKWKPIFETWLLDRRKANYRSDVIIRDVRRFDKYPDSNPEEKGFRHGFALV
jgi:hypothetical protein